MSKLTDRTVKDARSGAKDRTLFDTELPGFALKVTPHGRKVFLLQYWSPIDAGKRRRFTIGTLGDTLKRPDGITVKITATTARAEAERLRGIVRDKRDPFLEKMDAAAAEGAERLAERARVAAQRSVRAVAAELLSDVDERPKGARTRREYARLLDKHLLNVRVASGVLLGDRPISDVGEADALAVRRQTYTVTIKRAGKKATKGRKGQKGTPAVKATTVTVERTLSKQPVLANRVQQLARSLINYAERRKARPYGAINPFGGKRWHNERETRKALTADEVAALHTALLAEDDGERGGSVDAIKLLLFTGMRKNEALSLRWDAIDAERGLVTLRNTKTGESVRPLSVEALAVLAQIPRRGVYVFPSPTNPRAPRTEIKRTWLRVRARAGFTEPLHSLRNTMASAALNEGVPLAAVGAILGHVRPETTARYAKFGPLAAKVHADVAAASLGPKVSAKGVTDIRSRRKASK